MCCDMRVFVILCFVLFSQALVAQQVKQLLFQEETHDFGLIGEENGPVNHEFVFTNAANRPVRILNVQASCGCTTPDWSKQSIEPGKTGFIQARFDPKGRPGFFNKSLTITTDLEASPIVLQIKGQVTHGGKPSASDFPNAHGNLAMKVSSFNMGKVFLKDEFVSREFPVYNKGSKPVSFTGKFVAPGHIRIEVNPLTLGPGEKGMIRIGYNGFAKNQYGFQSDNIEIVTTDELNPTKSFPVYATLEEYFPKLSEEELARAPLLRLSDYAMDFGKIKANANLKKEVVITNAGKKELKIRSLQGNCTCVVPSVSKSSLKPGESGVLIIEFNPIDRTGTQQKAVTVYSNDPRNPVQRFTFSAYVE